jgi:hypothetical protein
MNRVFHSAEEAAVNLEGDLDRTKLAELMVTQSESEANIIKSILEESGVSCTLITPVPHNLYPFTVNGLASIRIMVLDSEVEEARAILQEHRTNLEPEAGEPEEPSPE